MTRSRLKRITASEIEDEQERRNLPVDRLINFGPVTLVEIKAMGFRTYGDLEDVGWEEVCRRWVDHYPERLNVNAFIGVIATIEGIAWTKVTPTDRARARRLVDEIKRELGATTKCSRPRSRN